jgi:hypothetical protein
MTSPVDPNDVLMTGENSFIRFSPDGGKTQSDRASHWRVLWCPAGAGHALFPAFADTALPVAQAAFTRSGGADSKAVERVTAPDAEIVLTWQDFLPPFVLNMPPGSGGRPIGVFSTFFPARVAQIGLNGRTAAGAPWQEKRGDRDASSACLAWSETWVKPRG